MIHDIQAVNARTICALIVICTILRGICVHVHMRVHVHMHVRVQCMCMCMSMCVFVCVCVLVAYSSQYMLDACVV